MIPAGGTAMRASDEPVGSPVPPSPCTPVHHTDMGGISSALMQPSMGTTTGCCPVRGGFDRAKGQAHLMRLSSFTCVR